MERAGHLGAGQRLPRAHELVGRVLTDRWIHIANVNDPVAKTSTLYVDGAPVLRNSIDAVGLGTANQPWRIGSTKGEGPARLRR